jgi:ribosomal protein S18 acetylase RimI-like enzyme
MYDFTIVEYDPSHAAAVAEMWSRSGDSWGGYNIEITEESVRQEEELSPYVNLYLAAAGDEVVGYCKIDKWTEEEGALYIGGLNVRPDYHGKKIGKALMLKSVERTAELDWPRLDLHTWAGNTKAVPLYKKTGFFWEERDEEVYLVNFIPGILKNELVRDFFDEADWYRDSTRPIIIEPDGREENKFTYFTYTWEKNGRKLLMEFARRGRGLRRIDCDEFSVTAAVENLDLVFEKKYRVRYDFVNKTAHPLDIEIAGKNDKNIIFDFSHRGAVEKELTVTGDFFVGKIEREQSRWKTHPRVSADIIINGRKACFQLGIVPKFPARIRLENREGLSLFGVESAAYLNIENNLDEKAAFNFIIPQKEGIEFLKPHISAVLLPKEKTSIRIPFILRECCVYSAFLDATARPDKGKTIKFKREVGSLFHLHSGVYYGEMTVGDDRRAYVIGNGAIYLRLFHVKDSFLNEVFLSNGITGQPSFRYFPPKLGKPFSEEFINRKPESVSYEQSHGSVTMRAIYRSGDFKEIEVEMCCRLFSSGIAERWFEVRNTGETALDKELYLSESFRCDMKNAVIPYKGKFIETRDETVNDIWLWDDGRLTENWIFARGAKGTMGLTWAEDTKLCIHEWVFNIEHKAPCLGPGESFFTKPVTASMNTFSDWRGWRDFSLGKNLERAPLTESLELCVNHGNPFVDKSFEVEIIEHKQKNLDGVLSISSTGNQFPRASLSFKQKDQEKNAVFRVNTQAGQAVDTVELDAGLNILQYRRRRVIFPKQKGSVKIKTVQDQGYEIFEADNGVLSIRSAPKFAPCVYSCTYRGVQWFHSSFPAAGPKDWWNPWTGGLFSHPHSIETRPLLKEDAGAEFVTREDTFGNRWKGIVIELAFEKHEDYKGMIFRQYFLLLPGIPVLFNQAEIIQNTGEYFNRRSFSTECFALPDETIENGGFSFSNKQKQQATVMSGKEEMQLSPPSMVAIKGKEREESLYVYSEGADAKPSIATNKATTSINMTDRISCEHGDTVFMSPKFFIFSVDPIEDEWAGDLSKVSLKDFTS